MTFWRPFRQNPNTLLGIDSKYPFSFTGRPAPFQQLVMRNGLQADSVRVGSAGLLQPFGWWPTGAEQGLTAYWRPDPEQWFQYLWYDARQQQAYYLEYGL